MMMEVYREDKKITKSLTPTQAWLLGNGEALQSILMRGVGIAMQRMH